MNISTQMYIARITDAIYDAKRKKDLSGGPVVINMEAPPGVGKTKICQQVAESTHMKTFVKKDEKSKRKEFEEKPTKTIFSVVDAQLLNNPGDIAGALDVKDGETVTASRNELFGDLLDLKVGEAGVLLIDDIKRLHPQILQEAMPLLQDGRIGPGKFLGGNVVIVVTSNPDGGGFHGTRLDAAQKSRMITYHLGIEVESWLKWAAENDIHDTVIAYIAEYIDALYDTKTYTVNPRLWTILSAELTAIENSRTLTPPQINKMIEALIDSNLGKDHGFYGYYKTYTGGNVLTIMEISRMIKENRIDDIIKHIERKDSPSEIHKVLRLIMASAKKYGIKPNQIVDILSVDSVTVEMAHIYMVFWRKDDKMFDALSNSDKLKDYVRKAYFGGR